MNYSEKLNEISKSVENNFGPLNPTQLNWKSEPNVWSIAQCLQHLIVSNEKYFPIFENVSSGKHKMTFWEKYNPLTNYTGKTMVKTLGPVVTKKFVSPKLFLPAFSEIKSSIIDEFLAHQNKLTAFYTKLKDEKYDNVIVTSPVAALLSIKLRDVQTILVVHEERHLQQMIRIKEKLASS